MGDFLASMLPPGLIDVLSALIPPVVVATVFCAIILKILRREMAPRRMDGTLVSEDAVESGDSAAEVERTEATNETPIARAGERTESDGR
ncbi:MULTISPECIES: hypothetical protein [Nocardiopsis]|uniref:Uncharacterized protein n=1 Tax=Nocardiopsis aegyptia TaxID=220378 RepID=A0A7Z0J9Z3_9ACTN|nr:MULTISPECIES: hypothetical protein [Nocardiopsis]KOX16504.1 hypothetical protein ADL05_11960 [Nocardiopsis sp. NRRL B-16309]NYJ34576.1 hypothetical protein [Nocardiopsis aegyptia]